MTVTTSDWDASEYLETDEDVSEYLTAIMEEGDPALLQAALGDIAQRSLRTTFRLRSTRYR